MAEKCIENEDRIPVEIEPGRYQHEMKLEGFLNLKPTSKSALLILNQEIDVPEIFLNLWSYYDIKVCADGGANRLYDFFRTLEFTTTLELDELRKKHLPNYIIGDLDSLRDDVRQFYLSNGVVIIKQNTQYSTDFTKSTNLITLHFNDPNFRKMLTINTITDNFGIDFEDGIHLLYHKLKETADYNNPSHPIPNIKILALGGIDGRFDQTIHSMTQFYTLRISDPFIDLYYLTHTDLIFLIPSSGCLITYEKTFRDKFIGCCGLLPIGAPTELVETIGLKWDIQNWPTSVTTGRVSSNNRFCGIDKCFINSKDPIVFNVEIFVDRLTELF
ncbi:hypothetical protein TBLA_0D01920 [Henningerozyma blattae CBS 6284]|uniref:Thiamine pyrophosphokinase n=1 Tax=Henningerozyma blattae (strain ATCC 34711 / CBS 6284 / DSM 70876 / NBRC 10599 / NRRL Y-10934 / UCD 77-7) TaxID=1071380 RepID=I2H2U7_HENB6|nr:hypothetical protein TBLA_0D01920 [Tetrapisispora blattae CBS 6284]CCH60699.1 hypothetical protein TBLA_0D01920 [Tetrapisispora blattae CBS 6284]